MAGLVPGSSLIDKKTHARLRIDMPLFLWFLEKFGIGDALAKVLLALLGAVLFLAAIYGVYWAGEHSANVRWEAKVTDYKNRLEENQKRAEAAIADMQAANDKVISALKLQLIAEKNHQRKVLTEIQEVIRYVTPEADSHCIVPAGAVRLLDLPLMPAGSGDTPVPESGPGNADAPSGIALSQLVGIEASNLSECAVRGEVIKAWQSWYNTTSTNWEKTRASIPKAPALPN
jgi:hypothetical protein